MPFKKGKSGNPNGRPPVLLPEVQKAIDANRNAMKVLILSKLEGKVGAWVERIVSQGTAEGDIQRFKTLIEIALGKMVDEPPEFPISDEEKLLILEFRRRKNERIVEPSDSNAE